MTAWCQRASQQNRLNRQLHRLRVYQLLIANKWTRVLSLRRRLMIAIPRHPLVKIRHPSLNILRLLNSSQSNQHLFCNHLRKIPSLIITRLLQPLPGQSMILLPTRQWPIQHQVVGKRLLLRLRIQVPISWRKNCLIKRAICR